MKKYQQRSVSSVTSQFVEAVLIEKGTVFIGMSIFYEMMTICHLKKTNIYLEK